MTFVYPFWLWLLPVGLALVLLLHARRRRDVVVPSLIVWRQVADLGASTPSRRSFPWRDRSLWLQLLAVTALVFALARPTVGANATNSWIVLLDNSLSMNAQDVEPDRFSAALAKVEERWAGRSASGRVSLVGVGTSARVIAADWQAGPGLERVLATIEPTAGVPDWSGAASRAALLMREDGRAEVAVVSDAYGAAAALDALEAVGIVRESVYVLGVGAELANVGIGDVEAELRGDDPDQWTIQGNVVTAGFKRGDVVRVVAAYRPPGTSTFLPWGAEDVAVDSDGRGNFAIPLDLPGSGEVQIRGPEGDHLPADDATIVSLRSEPLRIAIVGTADPALLRALAAIGGLEVYAASTVPQPSDASLLDLIIVTDAELTSAEMPATSTVWLGVARADLAAGAAASFAGEPLQTAPHPLTTDIDITEFEIGDATPLELPTGATALLSAGNDVLAWARSTTSGRQVALGFALSETSWTAQTSFPAFVAALVEWAAPRSWTHEPGGCRVGERCDWPAEAFTGSWQLVDPNGEIVNGTPVPTALADDQLAHGVWLGPLFDAGYTPTIAGSYQLLVAGESVQLPVSAPPLTGEPSELTSTVAVTTRALAPELWRWLVGLATACLLADVLLSLRGKRSVVRRKWRLPLTLGGAALGALLFGVFGVPLPDYGPGDTVVWVGTQQPPAAALAVGRANWQWVPRRGATVPAQSTEREAGLDLAMALEEALAAPQGPGELRIVASSDNVDSLSVMEFARLAATANSGAVSIDVVGESSVDSGANNDVSTGAVLGVTLPDRIPEGSTYNVLVDLQAPENVAWQLTANLSSESVPRAAEDTSSERRTAAELPLPSSSVTATGQGAARVELELEAGVEGQYVYELALNDSTGAPLLPATIVTVPVGEPPAVLLVATEESRGNGLAGALEAQGLDVERSTPFRMPGTLERLAAYDSVMLVDVSANDLFPEYQALLGRYVRELGGGLTIVGGRSAFGPGGYYATPLEEVSPLSARITDEAPEVAMAFVLDRSGSMSGAVGATNRMDLAKAATLEALGLLGERSLAAIVVFDTEARTVLPLTPVEQTPPFTAALTSVTPAGGTSIYPGLLEAYRLMSESDSATRHVVVMTDGLSQEGDFAGVLDAMKEAGITTTFVGVGDAADRRQLTNLAALGGGTLHMALDFRALPSLLAQEALMLAATPIEEGPVQPRWAADGEPEFLTGVGDLPPLQGYVKTTPKDEASIHAYADEEDPLLASWRYGLGRVAAFASDADGRWSRAWINSDGFGPLWSQLTRWVSSGAVREPWSPRLGRRGDVLDVVVDLPREALEVESAQLPVVTLATADGSVMGRQRLEKIEPGRAAVSFELGDTPGADYTISLSAAPQLGLTEGFDRRLVWPLPPGPTLRSDVVALSGLAEATDGAVYESVADLDLDRHGRAFTWQSRSGAWLLVGLILFLASLAARYGVSQLWPWKLRARSAARTRTA